MMYATINVLEAGAALKVPGVKAAAPPAALKTPALLTNGTAPPAPSVSSAVRIDKQISVAVLCGALLSSFACYFL
jgi:hypothetical protein